MIRKARFILCAAVLYLLQVAVVPRFSYGPLRPDLLAAAAVFLGLEADRAPVLWGAFALGLLHDLGSAGPFGLGPLLLVPVVYGLWRAKAQLVRDSALLDLGLTFAAVLAWGTARVLVGVALTAGTLRALLPAALGQAAFTAALSPLLFLALARAGVVGPSPSPAQS